MPGTVLRAKEVTDLQKPSLVLPFLWRMESTHVLRHQAASERARWEEARRMEWCSCCLQLGGQGRRHWSHGGSAMGGVGVGRTPRRGVLCVTGGQDCTRAEKFLGSGLGCPRRDWGVVEGFRGGH